MSPSRTCIATAVVAAVARVAPATAFAGEDVRRDPKGVEMARNAPPTGYAPVNGLNMYYEIHGTGQPLVVLHGAYMTIELMGKLVPGLAGSRQVIAVEFQGHGHTADVDRPITYEQLADDTAVLLRHLGIGYADAGPTDRRALVGGDIDPLHRTQGQARALVAGPDHAGGRRCGSRGARPWG